MNEEKPLRQIALTPRQARAKAESFCAYQERSHQEVRDKLYSWGLHRAEVETLIAELIADNFLNESRFALAYVSGKFRMKQWGRYKIRQGLQAKGLSGRLLQEALDSLDEQEYRHTLEQLLHRKAASLKEHNRFKRQAQLARYAAAKGFENDLIFEILNDNDL